MGYPAPMSVGMVSGGFTVRSYATVASFGSAPLEVSFKIAEKSILEVEFRFTVDSSRPQDIHTFNGKDNKRLIIELINYHGQLGAGIKKPVRVGENKAEEFYLHFWVSSPSEEGYMVSYTLYGKAQEKEDDEKE